MSTLYEDPTFAGSPDQSGVIQSAGQQPPGIGIVPPDNAPAPSAGVGLSPQPTAAVPVPSFQQTPAAQAPQPDLMTALGNAAGEVGAGLQGRPSPMALAAEAKRKDDALKIQQGRENLTALQEGLNVVQKMPASDAKNQFVAEYAKTLGPMQSAFTTLASQPTTSAKLLAYAHDSRTAQQLMDADPSGAALSKAIADPNGNVLKTINAEIDVKQLPMIQRKVDILLKTAPLLDPQLAQDIKTRGYATHADILQLSDEAGTKLPVAALSPADLPILNDHQDALYAGDSRMATGKTTQQILADSNKTVKDTGTWGDPYTMNGAQVQKNSVTGEVRQAVSRVPATIINLNNGGPAPTLSDDAIDAAAQRYRVNQTLPTGMGRTGANAGAILNRAAELAKAAGQSGEADTITALANKANTAALGQVSKQENMIGSFEKTANMNADLALAASDKVDRTGVPVLNRWIQAGRQNITGDVAASQFNAYNNVFANEYAKVISGSMGNTPVSDQARQHALDVINTAQTKEQYAGVVQALKADMANRMAGFKQQRTALTQGLSAPGAAAATAPATTLPQGWSVTVH